MVIENGVNGIKVNNINYYIHFNCVIVHIFLFHIRLGRIILLFEYDGVPFSGWGEHVGKFSTRIFPV